MIDGEKFFLSEKGLLTSENENGKVYALQVKDNVPYLFSGIDAYAQVQTTNSRPVLWLKFGLLLLLLILLTGQFWNKGSRTSKFITLAAMLLLLYLLVLFPYIGFHFEQVLFYGIDNFLSIWLWLPLLSFLLFFVYLLKEDKAKIKVLLLNSFSYGIVAFLLFDFRLLFEF